MILVRDVFRLKFGKARDALAVWKEMAEQGVRSGVMSKPRVGMTDPALHEMYQKFTPLVDSGYYLLSRMELITR